VAVRGGRGWCEMASSLVVNAVEWSELVDELVS
jgi:hypothetical protein